MKCPKCGGYIPEGHLYCEKCGEEISIVPEFDPEVENRINESLSGVADNLRDDVFHTKRLLPNDSKDDFLSVISKHIPTIIAAIAILIVAISVSFLLIAGMHNTRDKEELAEECYVEGNLGQAIEYLMEKIDESEDLSSEEKSRLMFKLYEYEIEAGSTSDAIDTLKDLTDDKIYDSNTVMAAFEDLVSYYEENGEYNEIIAMLEKTENENVIQKYSYYFSESPTITPEDGEYDKLIEVVINSSTDGDIYYTVNGDTPDELSIKYNDVLILEEEGDYVIKAVCINKYGVTSDVATAIYTIENLGPAAPEVLEESGDYSSTTMIVAVCESGYTIYYTTDGSDPTTSSKIYTEPISMPLGTTVFKFVAADQEGNLSDIVEREYHLAYTALVSVDQARTSIIDTLVKLDILLDSSGKVRSEEGYYDYIYDNDIEISGSGQYYKFIERHYFNDGSYEDTGLLYAVNTHDGKVNRLGYDSSGNYTLITISNR